MTTLPEREETEAERDRAVRVAAIQEAVYDKKPVYEVVRDRAGRPCEWHEIPADTLGTRSTIDTEDPVVVQMYKGYVVTAFDLDELSLEKGKHP